MRLIYHNHIYESSLVIAFLSSGDMNHLFGFLIDSKSLDLLTILCTILLLIKSPVAIAAFFCGSFLRHS